MTTVGSLFMGLALVSTVVSIVALFWGRSLGPKEGEGATNLGYYATFIATGAATVACGIVVAAFLREDFTFMYVAQHHPTDVSPLRWLFQLSAIWAGREGSFMFWMWLITLFGAYVAWKRFPYTDQLSNIAIAIINVVQGIFLAKLFTEGHDPFKVSPPEWFGPGGELLTTTAMNPLLQHWAMILHPPTLFIGYAGFTVPFAFAMAALFVNDGSKEWVLRSDRITVFAWLFLALGNGIGAIWAYVVLGWGGYWAWDPVENASLIPQLTGIALLHAFTVYRKREGFKWWSVMMAAVTFAACILGTFIVRSGIIQSVHAFQEDLLSAWLFGFMMVLPIVLAAIGLWYRDAEFRNVDQFESLTSKEASFYFTNVIMILSSIVIAAMTLSPAFGGRVYGRDTFDALAHPFGIIFVLLMAVCPYLSWLKTDTATFWKHFRWPAISAAVLSVPLMAIWYFKLLPILQRVGSPSVLEPEWLVIFYSIVGNIAAALAITSAIYLFVEASRKRMRAKGESALAALGNIFMKARIQSGGYITHLGIGITVIGLIGSSLYVDESRPTLPNVPGSQINVGGYDLIFQGIDNAELPNGDTETWANFDIYWEGEKLGTAKPGKTFFFRQQQEQRHADVVVEFFRDVFLVFDGVQDDRVVLTVKINPLISWVWFGFGVMCLGATWSMWPRREPEVAQLKAVPAPAPSRKKK